jgi:6-phosphogluconolactonase
MTRLFQRNSLTRFGVMVALSVLTLPACTSNTPAGGTATSSASVHSEFVYVGTLQSHIDGLRLDTSTGELTAIGTVAQGLKSTWITAHPELPVLYGVDDDSAKEGSITAYAVNRGTGTLSPINATHTGGHGTTFLRFELQQRVRVECRSECGRQHGTARFHHSGNRFGAEPSADECACAQYRDRSFRTVCARS